MQIEIDNSRRRDWRLLGSMTTIVLKLFWVPSTGEALRYLTGGGSNQCRESGVRSWAHAGRLTGWNRKIRGKRAKIEIRKVDSIREEVKIKVW